jgi:Zn-dependent peptidase ImmA (M78 family)
MDVNTSDPSPSPDQAAAQLARRFQVSKQAMKIRLEELNLLPQATGPLFSDQVSG